MLGSTTFSHSAPLEVQGANWQSRLKKTTFCHWVGGIKDRVSSKTCSAFGWTVALITVPVALPLSCCWDFGKFVSRKLHERNVSIEQNVPCRVESHQGFGQQVQELLRGVDTLEQRLYEKYDEISNLQTDLAIARSEKAAVEKDKNAQIAHLNDQLATVNQEKVQVVQDKNNQIEGLKVQLAAVEQEKTQCEQAKNDQIQRLQVKLSKEQQAKDTLESQHIQLLRDQEVNEFQLNTEVVQLKKELNDQEKTEKLLHDQICDLDQKLKTVCERERLVHEQRAIEIAGLKADRDRNAEENKKLVAEIEVLKAENQRLDESNTVATAEISHLLGEFCASIAGQDECPVSNSGEGIGIPAGDNPLDSRELEEITLSLNAHQPNSSNGDDASVIGSVGQSENKPQNDGFWHGQDLDGSWVQVPFGSFTSDGANSEVSTPLMDNS